MNLKRNQLRIIMAILVSQFLLVSILSGFLYAKASHTLKAQSKEYYASMMQQLNHNLDHAFREVENVITGISRDPDLYDYARLKADREWIRILRTNERIDALIAANESINSIWIYYEDRKEVLDNRKGLVAEDKFYDRNFLRNGGEPFIYPDWEGPRISADESLMNPDNGKKVLTVVKPLGYVNTFNTTSIIVNIPWDYLESIIEELGFHGEMGLYLYKENADPIPLNKFSESLDTDASSMLKDQMELNGTRYLATSLEISTDWNFISLIPERLLLHDINQFLRFTLMISFGVLILGAGASFFLSNLLQEPISRIFRQLNGEEGIFNELGYVNGYILSQLFISPDWGSKFDIEQENFPIDFNSPYRVLLISFSLGETNCWNRAESFLKDILKEREIEGFMVPSRKDREIIIILNSGYDDGELIRIIEGKTRDSLIIGISQSVRNISRVPLAYDQAGRVLMNKVAYPRRKVFLFDPAENGSEELPATIRFKSENRIKELFRTEDNEGLSRFLDDEIDRAVRKNTESPDMIRFLFFQIIRILLECYRERGGKSHNLEDGEWGVWEILYAPVTMEGLREKLHELIGRLLDNLPGESDIKTMITAKTKRYIEENLSGDLSVESIADNVFVSRSHLSKLFSEETGITLKDYIDRIRLEKAKALLSRNNYHIQEIGKNVGYGNAQSFIRLFKKKEGMTPGEYRKRLPLDKDQY